MAPKPIDVEIRAVGVDGVQRQLKLVSEGAAEAGEHSARGVESIAGAFLHVAHSGDLAGRELKEVIRGGGEILGLFGEGGALVGGVVLLGAAFYEAFTKAQEEIKKAEHTLDDLTAAHLRLMAEVSGNRLGAAELDIAGKYRQEFEKIEKEAPGWGAKILGALTTAAGLGDVFGVLTRIVLNEGAKLTLGRNTYGPGGESEKAAREEAERLALANAGALAQGTDPLARYRAQLQVIELERKKSIESGELSEEAADARAAGKRQKLYEQGADLRTQVAERLSQIDDARTLNVFERRQEAENRRYADEAEHVKRLTTDEETRKKLLEDIRKIHDGITDQIAKQRAETEAMGHAQAQQGSLNPIEQIRGELAAIELRKQKSIEAGVAEVDAAATAEAEKRNLFMASVDAAVRSNESLAKVATRLALDPLISYLEGLAISEGIKSIAHYADFDLVGGSLHAAAAAAALAGAHEIASLAGGGAGGGGRGSGGGGGGLSASSVGNTTAGSGQRTTVIIKGKGILNMSDPDDRAQFVAAIRAIAGDGDIDFLFDAA